MKKLLPALLLSLLLCAPATADVIKTIQAGATSQSVTLKLLDATTGLPAAGVAYNASGMDLKYWVHGANAVVDITEATQTANGAWSSGGFVSLGGGIYRFDVPNAAIASGTAVDIFGTVTGYVVVGGTIQLTAVNLQDSVRAGLTALPNAAAEAAGGLYTRGTGAGQINQPANGRIAVDATHLGGTSQTGRDIGASVLLSSGTGTGQISLSSGVVSANATQISGDSTAADNLEAAFDGTAGAIPALGIVDSGTAQAATSTTIRLRSAAAFADDELIGATVLITGGSAGVGQSRVITDYTSSTDTATVDAWTTTPTGSITYVVFGTAPVSIEGGGGGGATVEDIEELLPANFAALAISSGGIVQADVRQYGGSNGTFTSGRPNVNASHLGGTSQTGRDIGASVLLSSGTGTGQVSLSSGAVLLQPTQTGVTIPTVTTVTNLHASAATAAELAKVPKSDSNVTWNATALASINAQADTALADYDAPTNAEMEARTLVAANYATASVASAIQAVSDKLDDTLEDDGGTYRFTANALEQAPSGGGGGNNVTQIEGSDATDVLDARMAAALATYDPPTRAELTTDTNSLLSAISGLNDLSASDVGDIVIEDQGGGISLKCALAIAVAYAAGDLSTTSGTSTYEDPSGGETRITGTVTGNSRSASITCPTY